MNRRSGAFLLEQSVPVSIVVVGRKGRDFMHRAAREVTAEFTDLPDRPGILDIGSIARVVMDEYLKGHVDAVYIAYSHFVNTLVQRPTITQLLPVEPPNEPAEKQVDYTYEPSQEEVLRDLLPRFVEVQLYQAILESIASEHSARMVAMRNATDNAKELTRDLTLSYNKTRQANITKEVSEIASGAAALAEM